MSLSLSVKSPAKINPHLTILEARPDGFHNLFMLMTRISLFDSIYLEKTNGEISCPMGQFSPEENLAWKAATLLKKECNVTTGVNILIEKQIPMGAGLGGGSSNAATVLTSLNRLWELNLTKEELIRLGASLGSDVPFFLEKGPCWVSGRGEKLERSCKLPKLFMILIFPQVFVSTPWAFKEWDFCLTEQEAAAKRGPPLCREFKGLGDFLEFCHNDFEKVVCPQFKEIGLAFEKLSSLGAIKSLMSGSGSSVLGFFSDRLSRDQAFEKLSVENKQIWAVENIE